MYTIHINFLFMLKEETIKRIKQQLPHWMPGISIDCVIMGYHDQALSVLILKWKGLDKWSLPGGFIKKDEDLSAAAARVLEERTGLTLSILRQFETFGKQDRNEIQYSLDLLAQLGIDEPTIHEWFYQRFITVGFLALVDQKSCQLQPDFLSESCEWYPIHNIPELIFDHNEIVNSAREYLKIQLNHLPVGKSLLDEKFTMKDLQVLYETILDTPLDRANFQKRILKLGILNRHEKHMTGGAHKAPYLYSFNEDAYHQAVENGIGFMSKTYN